MTQLIRPAGLTRRSLLKTGAAVAAASALGAPALASARSIKIGSYGGYFEDSFKSHVYPAFTAATGIEVESVTQPNSSDWLVTMQNAATAGSVPADLSLYSRDTIVRASRIGGILKPLGAIQADALDDKFKYEDATGLVGVGAMSWFLSLVVNPNEVEAPASWAELWDGATYEGSLGLSKLHNSFFLDITAATFFDGPGVLSTREGIEAVVAKVAELRPNVALWWSAESQMEQAMKNEDVIAGIYYHDVAGIMAAEGFPIRSVFPQEGNPQDYGSWCLATLSEKDAEAAEFISFSSLPETQALMSRMIGTAPLTTQAAAGLSDEEFAAVSGTPAITPNYEAYLDEGEFIKETWDKMLASS
ncbi:MAG: extracellular solute-binding protein [Pseudomonadota bacterium]